MLSHNEQNIILLIILIVLINIYMYIQFGAQREGFLRGIKAKTRPSLRNFRANREQFKTRITNSITRMKRSLFGK